MNWHPLSMMVIRPAQILRPLCLAGLLLAVASQLAIPRVHGQGVQCDPTKVVTSEACAKCHANEIEAWKRTPHSETFRLLHRTPEAREIMGRLGLGSQSIKRNDTCVKCHYTLQQEGDQLKTVSGVSCESCHGAAQDWVTFHSDYGGPTATRESESAEHRQMRLRESLALGMRNPENLYRVAQSCYSCHTVPDEKLVNVGGHKAGSADFELVSWSQGMVRHNFLRTDGQFNARETPQRLRVMYVVGMIADLEYSTRAVAAATEVKTYGVTSARRAAAGAAKLRELNAQLQHPILAEIIDTFSQGEIKTNNYEQLTQVANAIRDLGMRFAETETGDSLSIVDAMIAPEDQFK